MTRKNLLDTKKYNHEYYLRNKAKMMAKAKKWCKENPEKVKKIQKRIMKKHEYEYQKRYSQKQKLKIFAHYGGNPPKCACCGETIIEFLTIDHIHGGGFKHRTQLKKTGSSFYRWLINNNFPEGFRVLCYNCNCGSRKNKGVCPHALPREC